MDAEREIESLSRRAAALREAGRVPEAIAAYQQLLARRPALPNSWYNLALLLRRARQPEAALEAYAQALRHRVDEPEEVHLNRGVIFADDLRRPDDAERELRTALTHNPHYVPAWLNLGNLHEDRGERPAAQAAYERVLQLEPGRPDALARLAGVMRIDHARHPLLEQLRHALSRPALPPAARAEIGFALGRALDACGAYDEAFDVVARANRDSRASAGPGGAVYDRVAQEGLVDALIAAGPGAPARAGAGGRRTPPVFICGMFRSGSTLAEQVLAAHPRVTAGGELDLLPALVRGPLQGDPTSISRRDADEVQHLADAYLEPLSRLFPGADLVTDKRPDNVLHVGLIKTLFPDAKIVHTVRDALDNCLSVHFLHLAHSQPYALDLLDTAHYQHQVRRLMAHWKRLFGGDILEFDYDAFVRDPSPATSALLQFCGLDWDDACLRFHEARGAVRTASVWQVRQPLYAHASGRWRRYARQLAPLREYLASLPPV